MSEEISEALQLDDGFLKALVGMCTVNSMFLKSCAKNIDKKHIPNPIVASIYGLVVDYYKKYNRCPSHNEILTEINRTQQDHTSALKYKQAFMDCVFRPKGEDGIKNYNGYSIEYMTNHINDWLRVITLKKGIISSANFLNKANIKESSKQAIAMGKALIGNQFGEEDSHDIGNISTKIQELILKKENGCTLGNADFDEMVLEGAKIKNLDSAPKMPADLTRGCLLPGEITIILGPSNAGKTTMLRTIAVENVKLGKKVAYVSHEEGSDKMSIGLFQSFWELTMEEMSAATIKDSNSQLKKDFEKKESFWQDTVSQRLFYYEYIKPGKMFCEDVIDMIEAKHEQLKQDTGSGFDLVIVDYPAKTKSREIGKGQIKEHEMQTYVYEQYRLLARKQNFHCVAPAQTNREGSKANKEESTYMEMENIAGSYGIGQLADLLISINRNKDDIRDMMVRFLVGKTRQGERNKIYISETRYDLGRTHGFYFGGAITDLISVKDLKDTAALIRNNRPKTSAIIAAKAGFAAVDKTIVSNVPEAKGTVVVKIEEPSITEVKTQE